MSLLPNNTYANPANSFYGAAGQGSASSLQSPAEIIPDAALGDAILNINSAGGASFAALSVIGGATADGDIGLGGGGRTYDFKADGASGNLTMAVIPLQVNQAPFLNYSPQSGNLILGDGLSAGAVYTNQKLFVQGSPANGNAVEIQSVNPTSGAILNTVASEGNLSLGSSAGYPSTVLVADVAGVAKVGIGGNLGATILMTAGAGGGINSAITNTTASPGSLVLGASTACASVISIDDLAGADTAVVDIKRGTATGTALRLQGAGTGIAPQISTDASAGGRLNLTASIGNPVPAISITDVGISLELPTTVYSAPTAGNGYGGITQQIINSGNPIGQLPFNITNPSAIGFYQILVRVGDNAAININGQINTFGYWNGSIWVAGGCGSSQPIGTGNLLIWFGSSATSRAQLILQNTGSADLSSVAVYLIPILSGSIPIMT